MTTSTETGDKIAPRRGRPRRLSLERIIAAALEIGVEQLSMNKLADALGVARAVLYNYVNSREELVQLVAAQAAHLHSFPKDIGQPWDVYVLKYARALRDYFVGGNYLVTAYAAGNLGPLIQLEGAEIWLSVLTRQGFTGPQALNLQQAIDTVALGSALDWSHARALADAGGSYAARARDAVAKRGEKELPFLSRHVETFARRGDARRYEKAVELLIAGAAAANPIAAAARSACSEKTAPRIPAE